MWSLLPQIRFFSSKAPSLQKDSSKVPPPTSKVPPSIKSPLPNVVPPASDKVLSSKAPSLQKDSSKVPPPTSEVLPSIIKSSPIVVPPASYKVPLNKAPKYFSKVPPPTSDKVLSNKPPKDSNKAPSSLKKSSKVPPPTISSSNPSLNAQFSLTNQGVNLGLFESDRDILKGSEWINDNIINIAQLLIKDLPIVKSQDIGGLQNSQNGREFKFKPVLPKQKWVQILHVQSNHWITASNVDVYGDSAKSDIVYIYDSLLSSTLSLQTKKQICSFVKPKNGQLLTFDIVNVVQQQNINDCGVFALAFAVEIVNKHDPAKFYWGANMREHLLDCLDQGRISRFPISRERPRLPLGRRIRHSILEDIHCLCGMPNDEAEPMIVMVKGRDVSLGTD